MLVSVMLGNLKKRRFLSHVMSKRNFREAAGFAGGGGAFGAGVASIVGNMGLAGAFGGVAIGATPVIAAGTIVGLAAFGIKKAFD